MMTSLQIDGNPGRKLVEIIELTSHPWYVRSSSIRSQSNTMTPHPMFAGFVEASHQRKRAVPSRAASW